MELRVLGPLELVGDTGVVDLPAGKPRALLALLLVERGRVVSADALVDRLWGERPPPTAAKIVQGYVSRLRRLLPPGLLETRTPGYVLRVGEGELDLARFESLRRGAAARGRGLGAERLAEALALWRGPALADVRDEPRWRSRRRAWTSYGRSRSRSGSTPSSRRGGTPCWCRSWRRSWPSSRCASGCARS